jgi:hypothetical protein
VVGCADYNDCLALPSNLASAGKSESIDTRAVCHTTQAVRWRPTRSGRPGTSRRPRRAPSVRICALVSCRFDDAKVRFGRLGRVGATSYMLNSRLA